MFQGPLAAVIILKGLGRILLMGPHTQPVALETALVCCLHHTSGQVGGGMDWLTWLSTPMHPPGCAWATGCTPTLMFPGWRSQC